MTRKKNKFVAMRGPRAQILVVALLVFAVAIAISVGFLAVARTAYVMQEARMHALTAAYEAKTGLEIARTNLAANFDNYGYDAGGSAAGNLVTLAFDLLDGGTASIDIGAADSTGIRTVFVRGAFGATNIRAQKKYMFPEVPARIYRYVEWNEGNIVDIDEEGNEVRRITGFGRIQDLDVHTATGDFWVCDIDNRQVVKINADGNVALQLTHFGGVQLCTNLHGVAVDQATGACWVADNNNDRVVKYGADGTELVSVKQVQATYPFYFDAPYDVAVDASGNCWVADYINDRVVKLSPAGAVLKIVTASGLDSPRSIAVDSTRNLVWVASFHNYVYLFDAASGALKDTSWPLIGYAWEVSSDSATGQCWVGINAYYSQIARLSWDAAANNVVTSGVYFPDSWCTPFMVNADTADHGCWVTISLLSGTTPEYSLTKVDASGNIISDIRVNTHLSEGAAVDGIAGKLVEVP